MVFLDQRDGRKAIRSPEVSMVAVQTRNEVVNQRETVRLLCVDWQACHLAGMPTYEVTLAEQRYLQAVKVLRMMEAR